MRYLATHVYIWICKYLYNYLNSKVPKLEDERVVGFFDISHEQNNKTESEMFSSFGYLVMFNGPLVK
jgi:hypothetical protein